MIFHILVTIADFFQFWKKNEDFSNFGKTIIFPKLGKNDDFSNLDQQKNMMIFQVWTKIDDFPNLCLIFIGIIFDIPYNLENKPGLY